MNIMMNTMPNATVNTMMNATVNTMMKRHGEHHGGHNLHHVWSDHADHGGGEHKNHAEPDEARKKNGEHQSEDVLGGQDDARDGMYDEPRRLGDTDLSDGRATV